MVSRFTEHAYGRGPPDEPFGSVGSNEASSRYYLQGYTVEQWTGFGISTPTCRAVC